MDYNRFFIEKMEEAESSYAMILVIDVRMSSTDRLYRFEA